MSLSHSLGLTLFITIPENLNLGSASVCEAIYIPISKIGLFSLKRREKNMGFRKRINLRGKSVSTLKKYILSILKGCNWQEYSFLVPEMKI